MAGIFSRMTMSGCDAMDVLMQVLARVALEALGYNPSKHFRKITAPVWFRVALKDHLCPSSVVLAAIRGSGLPDSQYTVQVGHRLPLLGLGQHLLYKGSSTLRCCGASHAARRWSKM